MKTMYDPVPKLNAVSKELLMILTDMKTHNVTQRRREIRFNIETIRLASTEILRYSKRKRNTV